MASPRTARPARQLRIGEVCRLTGLSADTLRYYERIGLLPAPPPASASTTNATCRACDSSSARRK